MTRSSLQARLMITTIGTLIVGISVVLVLLWLVSRSEMGYLSVSMSNLHGVVQFDDSMEAAEGVVVTSSSDFAWTILLLGLTVLAAIMVVSVLGAWFLNRSLFGRIGQISEIANALSERHLDVRFDTTARNDEIDQTSSAINDALDRLQAGFQRQQMFVASASHEMRTPLTIARTSLEIPLVDSRVPEDLRPEIQLALKSQSRLEAVLDSLLALTRSNDQGVPGNVIALDGEIETLVAAVQDQSEGPQLDWHFDLEPVTATVHSGSFSVALRNLLHNAVVHNHAGGWCRVSLKQVDGNALIEIENSGRTVDPESLDNLMQPFIKGEGSPGSGLGLAIVDRAITLLGGQWHMRARPEGGLQVQVVLPISPDCAGADQAHRADHRPAG